MSTNIVFFDTKPCDRESFERCNQQYGFNNTWLENHLTEETVSLTRGVSFYFLLYVAFLLPGEIQTALIDLENAIRAVELHRKTFTKTRDKLI